MKKIGFLLLFGILMNSCYKEDQEVGFDYMNGQTMTFVPSLPSNVNSVDYYWDDILIDTKTEMPFVLIYKIAEQSSGIHILRYDAHYTVSTGNSVYNGLRSASKSIRIK